MELFWEIVLKKTWHHLRIGLMQTESNRKEILLDYIRKGG